MTFRDLLARAVRGPEQRALPSLFSLGSLPSFVPSVDDDPRSVFGLAVSPRSGALLSSQVRRLEVVRSVAGRSVREAFDAALVKDLDTVDVLAYSGDGDSRRYYLVRRAFVPLAFADARDSGIRTTVAGAYVEPRKGQVSLCQAVENVLRTKYGLQAAGEPEFLGGPYYPSIGSLAEAVTPVAVRVIPPSADPRTCFGERFLSQIDVRGYTSDEIIGGFLRGDLHDMRAVELVFRFSRQRNDDVVVDLPSLPARADVSFPPGSAALPVLSQRAAVALATAPVVATPQDDVSVRVVQGSESPAFISATPVTVLPLGLGGSPLPGATPFSADVIARQGRNSLDAIAYWFEGARLKVAVQFGVCPAVWARNSAAHFIADEARLRQFHLTSCAMTGAERSSADRTRLIDDLLRRKVGLRRTGEPVAVGTIEPSPGYCSERVEQFLVPVDPRQLISEPRDPVYAVDVIDLLVLSDQGIVRDPRLSQLAHVLKYAYQYWNPEAGSLNATPEEIFRFQRLINTGSLFQAWVERLVPECDDRANRQLLYRRLKAYGENELGMTAIEFSHPSDQWFFRAFLPALSVRTGENPRKWHANLGHDALHQVIGDICPLVLDPEGRVERSADGRLKLMDFDLYAQLICESECVPAWFSDAKMPLGIGLEETREFSWRARAAEMLVAIAGDDDDRGQAIIRSLELDGVVPEELRAPSTFSKFRDVIHRYFFFRLMDREQLRLIYENWAKFPTVGEVALTFCRATNDAREFRRRIATSVKTVANYADGVNPLKSAIARLRGVEIPVIALRLAHAIDVLADHSEAQPLVAKLRRFIDGPLLECQLRLSSRLTSVRTQALTQENMDAFRDYEAVQQGVLQRALQYADELDRHPSLASTAGRLLPAFDPLVLSPARQAELSQLAEQQVQIWEQKIAQRE